MYKCMEIDAVYKSFKESSNVIQRNDVMYVSHIRILTISPLLIDMLESG